MDITNRKFVVVTADMLVHKNEHMEFTKVTEVTDAELHDINEVVPYVKTNDIRKYLDTIQIGQTNSFIKCLPVGEIVKIKEVKVLAVLGEIKLL